MARPRVISSVLIGLMFAVLVVASATDMLYRKVFNWLTVPAALVAIALNATQGWPGFKQSGTGLLIGLAIGIVFMLFFRFGGGDAKLFAVVGAFAGPAFLAYTVLYVAVAGLPLALIVMYRRGVFGYTLKNFGFNVLHRAMGAGGSGIDANSRAGRMPYALAILIGAVVAMLVEGWQ